MLNFAERRLSPQMRLVELRIGEPVPDLLRRLRQEGLSAAQIGERIEVPQGTVYRWLIRFGLDDSTLIQRALGGGLALDSGSGAEAATSEVAQ